MYDSVRGFWNKCHGQCKPRFLVLQRQCKCFFLRSMYANIWNMHFIWTHLFIMTIYNNKRDFNEIDFPNGGHIQFGAIIHIIYKHIFDWLTRRLNVAEKCSKMYQYLITFIDDIILFSVINSSFYQFCRL